MSEKTIASYILDGKASVIPYMQSQFQLILNGTVNLLFARDLFGEFHDQL